MSKYSFEYRVSEQKLKQILLEYYMEHNEFTKDDVVVVSDRDSEHYLVFKSKRVNDNIS